LQDTDYVYFSASTGGVKATPLVKRIGNIGTTDWLPLNMSLGPFRFDPKGAGASDPVVIAWIVLNSSAIQDQIGAALIQAGLNLLENVPGPIGIVAEVLKTLTDIFPGILPGGCDGVVAAERWTGAVDSRFSGYAVGDLWNEVAPYGSNFNLEHDYTYQSQDGCGRSSIYSVNLNITAGADPADM
jgi:hypothetical protein